MDDVKRQVQENYGAVARAGGCGCGGGLEAAIDPEAVGYSAGDLAAAPEGSNMGLGCGNPLALADLKPGETVLDLGSGGGFDCFLAANAVGPAGRAIGVDMTEAMISLARRNADKGGYDNVEFRLGDLEALPVDDGAVDVILSNCVINLVPDKPKAFGEAYRVLKPGGRLHVSDIVLTCEELPEELVNVQSYVNCVAGAVSRADYLQAMQDAGFTQVTVHHETDAALLLGSGCCTPPEEVGEESCCGEAKPEEPTCCCGSESADQDCCAAPEDTGCDCGGSLLELPAGLIVSLTVSARKPA